MVQTNISSSKLLRKLRICRCYNAQENSKRSIFGSYNIHSSSSSSSSYVGGAVETKFCLEMCHFYWGSGKGQAGARVMTRTHLCSFLLAPGSLLVCPFNLLVVRLGFKRRRPKKPSGSGTVENEAAISGHQLDTQNGFLCGAICRLQCEPAFSVILQSFRKMKMSLGKGGILGMRLIQSVVTPTYNEMHQSARHSSSVDLHWP